MFSAVNTLSLVLQSDCKDFASVRRFVAKTLHTLEDMSNDVNNIHFQSLRNIAQITRKKVKLDNLTKKEKFHKKASGAIFKTVIR